MRFPHIFIAPAFIGFSPAQEPAPPKDAKPLKVSISLKLLKERSVYAALDKRTVEKLAQLAEARWTKNFGISMPQRQRFTSSSTARGGTLIEPKLSSIGLQENFCIRRSGHIRRGAQHQRFRADCRRLRSVIKPHLWQCGERYNIAKIGTNPGSSRALARLYTGEVILMVPSPRRERPF